MRKRGREGGREGENIDREEQKKNREKDKMNRKSIASTLSGESPCHTLQAYTTPNPQPTPRPINFASLMASTFSYSTLEPLPSNSWNSDSGHLRCHHHVYMCHDHVSTRLCSQESNTPLPSLALLFKSLILQGESRRGARR